MAWFGPRLRSAIRDGGLSIAVTGGGSWLGRAFLETLAAEELLPAPDRLRVFASASRLMAVSGRDVAVEALAGAPPLAGGPWLLVHFAFLGKERTQGLPTAAFIAENDAIRRETLRIAKSADGLRMVFASSGAVYGPDRVLIDDPEVSPYGWCKVMHERAIQAWCAQRDVPLVVPRIFNIGGPWINKVESYALSSFILSALRDGVIRIMARRPVFRSFVHVCELNRVLCEAVLSLSEPAMIAFDTAGREVLEMSDLADLVATAVQPKLITIERSPIFEGDPDYYVGSGQTYQTLLARQGTRSCGIHRIVADTVAYLRS